jgi:uridine kinase
MSKLIGICGGSCSGKTTIVNYIISKHPNISVLHFDDYFLGSSRLDFNSITDWESPELYLFDRYIKDLKTLKSGKPIDIECNSRESLQRGIYSKTISPAEAVIVEGFLIFYNKEARELFDNFFFIDISEDELKTRRIARMKEGDNWDDLNYINTKLIGGHRKYVVPQKKYADMVLDGTKSVEILYKELRKYLLM